MIESAEELMVKKFYNNPKYVGIWNGYKVYCEDYGEGRPAIGLPQFVVYKDGKARLTTENEAFEIIKQSPDEE